MSAPKQFFITDKEMKNHSDRPEVITAKKGQIGVSTRFSETMNAKFMYTAIMKDSLIIRTSIPLTKFEEALTTYKGKIINNLF